MASACEGSERTNVQVLHVVCHGDIAYFYAEPFPHVGQCACQGERTFSRKQSSPGTASSCLCRETG